MFNILRPLALPVVLLAFAYYIQQITSSITGAQAEIIILLPAVLAIAALLISLRFNRSRMFFAVLTITLSYSVLYLINTDRIIENQLTLSELNSLWMPINFIVYSSLKERGIFTWHGGLRFGLLILPVLLVLMLINWAPDTLLYIAELKLVSSELASITYFPQISIAFSAICLLLLNGHLFIKPGPQNAAMFIGFITGLIMLHQISNILIASIYACSALLIITIAVIHESWSMAYLDQLTNLPGRRALDEDLMKLGSRYSIAMLDIDHFKKFNDQHGHDAGDQVLRMVAGKIRYAAGSGRPYRYGGEEFSIIFPGREKNEVMSHLESLRHDIEMSRFLLRKSDRRNQGRKNNKGKNVKVTISIGVASRNEKYAVPTEVIKAADKALYRAKKRGRNCICK